MAERLSLRATSWVAPRVTEEAVGTWYSSRGMVAGCDVVVGLGLGGGENGRVTVMVMAGEKKVVRVGLAEFW